MTETCSGCLKSLRKNHSQTYFGYDSYAYFCDCNCIFCSDKCWHEHDCFYYNSCKVKRCSHCQHPIYIKPGFCSRCGLSFCCTDCLQQHICSSICQFCQMNIPHNSASAVFWFDATTIPFGRAIKGHYDIPWGRVERKDYDNLKNNGYLCVDCIDGAVYGNIDYRKKIAITIPKNLDYLSTLCHSTYGDYCHTNIPIRKKAIRAKIYSEQKDLENSLQKYDSTIKLHYDDLIFIFKAYIINKTINIHDVLCILEFPFSGPPIRSIELTYVYRSPSKRKMGWGKHIYNELCVRKIKMLTELDSVNTKRKEHMRLLPPLQNIVCDYIDAISLICNLYKNNKFKFDLVINVG
ncbi:MAG: hypothetical protein Edafosvirus4_24 [Edafosvirus sp.]|uniref:Uncharacterized protein n=1 Tax=Edafosvirus sp. TaxID=2487765 RepID=A0A3G4ZT09_9VIRU|nr:MAG: hypothetical protein Edafosvirus4_24 [Edafosvirus sp.]